MIVLTRAELDELQCPGCGEHHLIVGIKPACHPDAGQVVIYHRPHGVLHLACVECNCPVAIIAVGEFVGVRH